MGRALQHRGPDASGSWADAEHGYAVAFRRLAIIDISENGNQPMTSPSGRYVIAFNGEIYNHVMIRKQLESRNSYQNWKGHCDTEVLLVALEKWGIQKTLEELNGMFAFALWDRQERRLILARDRFGEKPLYYGRVGNSICFGSELKALAKYPGWDGAIDRDVAALFLQYGYVPDPYCIFEGIHKLPPSHFVEIRRNAELSIPVSYWSLRNVVEGPRRHSSEEFLLEELHEHLKKSVRSRMEADVPLGALLSGGIDSSLIVALMQSQANTSVRTFTIGFDEPGFDESSDAAAIAGHLQTDHTALRVTSADALSVIPQLPEIWDEPFADASQIPTYLVSKLTREHVTVALSGDGGDELFCGYNRYCQGYRTFQQLTFLPSSLRSSLAFLLNKMPGQSIDNLLKFFLPAGNVPSVHDKFHKLARVLGRRSDQFYESTVTRCDNPESLVIGAAQLSNNTVGKPSRFPKCTNYIEQMMYLDSMSYLPGDILTKVDRASMAASLEVRAPFLDHKLAEFVWQMPFSMKMKKWKSKWALREILAGYMPRTMFERPKMGFGLPVDRWLRGPLRDWAEDLLSEDRLVRQNIFESGHVRNIWHSYLAGRIRSPYLLWSILMLSAWSESDTIKSVSTSSV